MSGGGADGMGPNANAGKGPTDSARRRGAASPFGAWAVEKKRLRIERVRKKKKTNIFCDLEKS